jgi:hypothetical protein
MRRMVIILAIMMLCGLACKKPYTPPAITINYNYLVIDGVINANPNGTTTILLSRTKNLTDSVKPAPENGAQVSIEGETGGLFPLTPQGNGAYTSNPLNLVVSVKYRLRILTRDGSAYQSDFVGVKQTPPIDSLSWKQDTLTKDVTIYAHTHDPNNQTQFYRWDHVETWQYRAAFQAMWGMTGTRIYYIDPYDQVLQQYNCWGTVNSTNIAIASSEALSQDLISYAPVNRVQKNAEKLMVRYSINVRQYGLTREAYRYWQIIEKSTQQTGTVFDPQPAQLVGNIHCTSNPAEPVIGYVSASYITEKRIFIDHKDVVEWNYVDLSPGCGIVAGYQDPNDFLHFPYPDTTFAIYYFQSGGGMAITKKPCVDCRRRGGTNLKPSFWQ